MTSTLSFEITPSPRVATMAVAPAMEIVPQLTHDPSIQRIYRQLSHLHFAGIVSLYGAPPEAVHPRPIAIEAHRTKLILPTYMASLISTAGPEAVEWFQGFEAGLSRWDEAGIEDPLSFHPEDPASPEGPGFWEVADPGAVLTAALAQLRSRGASSKVQNLQRHLAERSASNRAKR